MEGKEEAGTVSDEGDAPILDIFRADGSDTLCILIKDDTMIGGDAPTMER